MEEPGLNFALKNYTDDPTPDLSDIGQVNSYVIDGKNLDETSLHTQEEVACENLINEKKDVERFQLTGNRISNQLLNCETLSYLQTENHIYDSVPLYPSWNVHFSSATQTDQSMLFGYNWYNGWMNHTYDVGSQYLYVPVNGHDNNINSTIYPSSIVPKDNGEHQAEDQVLEEAAPTNQQTLVRSNNNLVFENTSTLDVSCNGGNDSKLSQMFRSDPLNLSGEANDVQPVNKSSSEHSEGCNIKNCVSKECDILHKFQSDEPSVIHSNAINCSLKSCYVPLIRVETTTDVITSTESVSENKKDNRTSKSEVEEVIGAENFNNSKGTEWSDKVSNIPAYSSRTKLPHSVTLRNSSSVATEQNMFKERSVEGTDKILLDAEDKSCARKDMARSYPNLQLESDSVSELNRNKPCESTVLYQGEAYKSKCIQYYETTKIRNSSDIAATSNLDPPNCALVKSPASFVEEGSAATGHQAVDKCQETNSVDKSKENTFQPCSTNTVGKTNFEICLERCAKIKKFLPTDNQRNHSSTKSSSKIPNSERTRNHISYLLETLPDLAKYFDIHRKVGEGTFSSVFLGTMKPSVVSQFPDLLSKEFAIKHLIPTILPKHIARELKFLHEIGGKDNVIGVDHSMREGDCCVFIMPYLPHKRFNEYVLDMDADETRDYIRNLMIALRRVHNFNVIHRDVKPSNFLYNRENKRYLLVDFGLSQTMHPHAKWFANERAKKRKRQEENFSEKMKGGPEPTCKSTENDSKVKRSALQPRSKEDINVQKHGAISQPNKRQKLTESGSRGQKLIAHLQQENASVLDNRRAPLTPKVANKQNVVSSQTFKLPYSSPKVLQKELSIRKKLFLSNNENELPKPSSTPSKFDSLNANLSSPLSSRKPNAQVLSPKSVPSNANADVNNQSQLAPVVSNDLSKQKFQILVPKLGKDGGGGQTLVRVQNSQVKSQVLKHLSPLESEMQRKLLSKKQGVKKSTSANEAKCFCKGLPQVCNICLQLPAIAAPRAGTPGFRPPEVLLKYPMQTTAVDMWAAGVIMLCILSGCYPFFRSPDDITALAEIMTVFGTDSIQSVAKSLGRTVVCGNKRPPLDLRKLCERLRRRRKDFLAGVPDNMDSLPICPKCENTFDAEFDGCLCLKEHYTPHKSGEFPPSAYDLLKKLLDLNPATRISAQDALQHPFLKGD